MKTRKVTEYPDTLIDATNALVENTQLFTIMMNIIFLKTNAYDSVALCTTMGIIAKWILHLERLGLPFPSNFDLGFFLKGIKIALEVDHSVSTTRSLHTLFKTLHYFPIDARSTLIQEMLSYKNFYSLFFSWSYNIRDLFIAFLLYQVEYLYVIRTTEQLGLTPELLTGELAIGQIEEKQTSADQRLSVKVDSQKNSGLKKAANQKSQGLVYRKRREDALSKFTHAISAIEDQL